MTDILANSSSFSMECPAEKTQNELDFLLSSLYVILSFFMSSLSLVGGGLIIYFIIVIPELNTKGRRPFIFLSISDMMLAIGNIIGAGWLISVTDNDYSYTPETGQAQGICVMQAIISTSASIASFCWTSIIALNIFLLVYYRTDVLTEKLWWLSHLLSWGLPIIIAIVTLSQERFGYDPCTDIVWWCWIRPRTGLHKVDTIEILCIIRWEIIAGKLWEIMSIVHIIISYTLVMYRIKKHTATNQDQADNISTQTIEHATNSEEYRSAVRKLTFVPMVYIAARIWGVSRFLCEAGRIHPGFDESTLFYAAKYLSPFQALGDSAQGLLNCIVFMATTPSIKARILSWGKLNKRSSTQRTNSTIRQEESSSESEEELAAAADRHLGGIWDSTVRYDSPVFLQRKSLPVHLTHDEEVYIRDSQLPIIQNSSTNSTGDDSTRQRTH